MRNLRLALPLLVLSLAWPAVSSAADKPKNQLLPNGTVKSVSQTSVTVAGKDKEMTFSVDAKTHVIGKGIGRKSVAAGGKPTIVDLLKEGDRVNVTYQTAGTAMHASKIEVTMAAAAR
jgi:hypothetical protein